MSPSEQASPDHPVRAARTLIIDLPGPDLDAESASLMAEFGFGGVCLFSRNVSTPERTRKVPSRLKENAMMASSTVQLRKTPRFSVTASE